MSDHCLDFDRFARTGLHEAVFCKGKSLSQIQAILDTCVEQQQPALLTRLDTAIWQQMNAWHGVLDYDEVSRTAMLGELPAQTTDRIAVVTAGSADYPVAREALRTLAFHGLTAQAHTDIGVSGLWRIQQALPQLEQYRVIICCAGMDAALPTVLAGLVNALIIAVPTSTGYGRSQQGETALNALLCSCGQGLVVTNIDNGFGAACAAIRALQ